LQPYKIRSNDDSIFYLKENEHEFLIKDLYILDLKEEKKIAIFDSIKKASNLLQNRNNFFALF
jgi:hypothetical protein